MVHKGESDSEDGRSAMTARPWRAAMTESLYGPDGFFTRPGGGPATHFRTAANQSPVLARALVRLLATIDEALGYPDPLQIVDVGAGRGELLTAMLDAIPPATADRVRATAVELAPAPTDLDTRIGWVATIPDGIVGLLIGTEWLDNVPLDVAEVGADGEARYVLVEPEGTESLGGPLTPADAAWLRRWWSLDAAPPGVRAEIGAPRDNAWRGAVGALGRGVALAVDYGHTAQRRPVFGTLTGFRRGRQVPPVPDGSCDLTAHVAMDAVREAGAGALVHGAADGITPALRSQRAALRALGVDGGRPSLALATADPAGYVRALASASDAAELTDPAGLGGHYWLFHPVGMTMVHT